MLADVASAADELAAERLPPCLRLRVQALSDAFAEPGQPEQVRRRPARR